MTGDGTKLNPYTVGSVEDLAELSGKSGYVIITNDIDFASIGKQSFDGITTGGDMYIDGQGHTINNFFQHTSVGATQCGLFVGKFLGSVKNLSITNAYIVDSIGAKYIGIFASQSSNCIFTNVDISGAILGTGSSLAAGFVGYVDFPLGNKPIIFRNCKANVNINNTSSAAGFIAYVTSGNLNSGGYVLFENSISACKLDAYSAGGFINSATNKRHLYFYDCVSQCSITTKSYGAGFVASDVTEASIAENCASICNIDGNSNKSSNSNLSGIFCARPSGPSGKIVQSYAKCMFSNALNAQGLGGMIITQSYSASSYINITNVRGLTLRDSPTTTSSFYDMDIAPEAVDTLYGATTENLKSAKWLREQGWAI